jgi:hypothetical protein
MGINFPALAHLDTLGLLRYEGLAGFKRTGFGKYASAFYFGKATTVEFPAGLTDLQLGHALLTQTGAELGAICGAEPTNGFEEFVQRRWMAEGLILSTPLAGRPTAQ